MIVLKLTNYVCVCSRHCNKHTNYLKNFTYLNLEKCRKGDKLNAKFADNWSYSWICPSVRLSVH